MLCVLRACDVSLLLQDSGLQKAADWALSVAIPVHMHITTNALVTDYVPTKYRGKQLCLLAAA